MLNSQRIFVDAVKKYCAAHGIASKSDPQGWLIIMQHGSKRHLAFGYDLGLNSAVAHRIANDKAATADVLAGQRHRLHPAHAVPQPETERVRPAAGLVGSDACAAAGKSRRHRRQAQRGHQRRLRVQGVEPSPSSNSPCTGSFPPVSVLRFRLMWRSKTKFAWSCSTIIRWWFTARTALRSRATASARCWSWRSRPRPPERRSAVLPDLLGDLDRAALDAILPAGQRRVLNWRHNLDSGAQPVLLEQGELREACVEHRGAGGASDRDTLRIDRRRSGRRRLGRSSKSIRA